MYMIYLYAVLAGLGATYALWIFFLAVMSLKRAKEAGQLTSTAVILGTPVLFVGYLLDFIVNTTVMTILLLEIPQETTVTARLGRHLRESTNWRRAIAAWAEPLLDPYDPSGDHI
jgi:hypothetical protein